MAGHLFITQADMTKLAVDARLLPTDSNFSVTGAWGPDLGDSVKRMSSELSGSWLSEWRDGILRAKRIPREYLGQTEPSTWIVNVGGWSDTPAEWFLEGAARYLDDVAAVFASLPQTTKRSRRLVALPVVGTGAGGGGKIRGKVLSALVNMLLDRAKMHDFDIVLVTKEHKVFAAAQEARREAIRRLSDGDEIVWGELSGGLRQQAQTLSRLARDGRLVLFIGAGASAGAGLPSWTELLDELALEAGIELTKVERLRRFPALDQARLIASKFEEAKTSIGEAIASRLKNTTYSLTHSLLAALPVNEVVTTNYDQLFEVASEAIGRPTSVIPYHSDPNLARWILKLHGCVTHPADIVLTRDDYLRFAENRWALAGIVQAMLITRHMLFVGFSLSDDNFHRVAYEVRRAIGGEQAERTVSPFGTALFLFRDALLETLWESQIHCVGMGENSSSESDQAPDMARKLEVFLDLLASEATVNTPYLLDPTFSELLSKEEEVIMEALNGLERGLGPEAKNTHAGQRVLDLIRNLGGNDRSSHPGT